MWLCSCKLNWYLETVACIWFKFIINEIYSAQNKDERKSIFWEYCWNHFPRLLFFYLSSFFADNTAPYHGEWRTIQYSTYVNKTTKYSIYFIEFLLLLFFFSPTAFTRFCLIVVFFIVVSCDMDEICVQVFIELII